MTKVKKPASDAPETPGGLPPEKVEDRPFVAIVKPEDYPEPAGATHKKGAPTQESPRKDRRTIGDRGRMGR